MTQKESVAEISTKSLREVEDVIARAIKKVNGKKANDLCKYIPMSTGGYMHHFTLKKMKNRQPQELGTLIEKFIINSEKPSSVKPKQRAPRGSRKRKEPSAFTRQQLERLLQIARSTGDKEMITILAPRKSLASCKRDLIASIRQGRVEQELWHAYSEASALVNSLQQKDEQPVQ